MALSRRAGRREDPPIFAGFVDALATLLLVLMFVLTIFTIVQSVMRDTIDTQDVEMDALTDQVSQLADALGLEQTRAEGLEGALASAEAQGQEQSRLIATLQSTLSARESALDAAQGRIASFEEQVATLLTERDAARGEAGRLTASLAEVEAARTQAISEQQALQLALATARQEIDAQTEQARLAAARREALEVMIANMRREMAEGTADLTAAQADLAQAQAELTEAEKTRLADLAAAQALRERLASSQDELTAMSLSLEEERKRAEETLTLLAAAQAQAAGDAPPDLLEVARRVLSEKDAALVDAAQKTALLNQQVAELRGQLGTLQGLLDAAQDRDAQANVQIETLGSQLNSALAQVAAEERRRAALEEAERVRLEAENRDLSRFRSEFFGQLSQVLEGREGVQVRGDRFVFSSEVLFPPGSADLSPAGQEQIAGVARLLREIADQIPPGIDWIIRVDGHTDNVPLSGQGEFRDNWALSQARALSVVRYMQDVLGFPPNRMAATGFGEWQPLTPGTTEAERAQNRRIELKLTER